MQCDHCHLEFESSRLFVKNIGDKECYFCCQGCEQVYQLLHNEGLSDFYKKIQNTTLSPITQNNQQNLDKFDTEAFAKKYIKYREGFNEIALVIEHIHCIACVWLNEKLLQRQPGIIKAQLNYTNNKATIIFDGRIIKPSEIINLIRSIGYDAHPYDPLLQEEHANKERKEYYIKMIIALFCTMNIMWIAVAQYAGYFSGITSDIRWILNIASFCLCVPAFFYSGSIFWKGAFYAIKNKILSMDILLVTGTSIAFLYSIYATFIEEETYFESIAMIITFVLIGRFLERRGRKIAVDSLDKLNAIFPFHITVIRENHKIIISPEEAKIGETIEVLPSERVALDGLLISDHALCDESALTGESYPVQKKKGDMILSGSIVLDSPILYQATHDVSTSVMPNIIQLVERSLEQKPRLQEKANQLSRYFSFTILLLALCSFIIWYFYLNTSIQNAITIAISVIIIACPCALALATPIASIVGLSNAINHKILFKESRFLEVITQAHTIIFDKTGTLTQGKLKLNHKQYYKELSKQDLQILFTLTSQNHHPVSQAIKNALVTQYTDIQEFSLVDIKQLPGLGMIGSFHDQTYIGGNLALLEQYQIPYPSTLNHDDRILFCFANTQEILAVFFFEDELKPNAKEIIEQIQRQNMEIILASGDRLSPVKKIADQICIDTFYAHQTPQEKAKLVDRLHEEGKIVIMVGDGINDTVAFAKSDIAIAMGNSVDVALDVSDIVLLDNQLHSLIKALIIGKYTFRLIKQNIWISLFYNALTIPLAMAGYVIPVIAAASMSLSSLIVVCNSLRTKM